MAKMADNIVLCKMADFQHRLISGIFGVFSNFGPVFCTELLQCEYRIDFEHRFRQFKILAQIPSILQRL